MAAIDTTEYLKSPALGPKCGKQTFADDSKLKKQNGLSIGSDYRAPRRVPPSFEQ